MKRKVKDPVKKGKLSRAIIKALVKKIKQEREKKASLISVNSHL